MKYQRINIAAFLPDTQENSTPKPTNNAPMPINQVEADIEHAIAQLEQSGTDITYDYGDWVKIGFAFASLGESGRNYYHRASRLYAGYDYEECEKQFEISLRKHDGRTNIASFFLYCKKAGVNISPAAQNRIDNHPAAPKAPAATRDKSIPYELEFIIRQKKRNGLPAASVITDLSVAKGIAVEKLQPVIEKIFAEKAVTIEKFWTYVCENEVKDKWVLKFFHNKYISFLREAGFGMFREGGKFQLVRVLDNIVRYASRKEVKDFVQEYIVSLPFEFDGIYRVELEDKIKREHLIWFAEGTMEWLPDIGAEFHRDTRDVAYFYFRNGFVEVTRYNIELRPYSQLDALIWETQIIDRDFVKIDMEESELILNSDFYRFCLNIAGHDRKRIDALLSSLGYLLHGHKVRTHSYAIILCDEAIGKGPAGRTGKGIIIQALKHIRNTVTIDGRNFRIENQFAFQRVQQDTQLIAFDDVDPKRLPFERLFSILTEGLSVERKQAGEVLIPFEDAPKILITTNETVIGEGGSYEGRMRELELAPYYSATFTPEQEFERILFDDWPIEEWQLFYNLMMHCTQLYMLNGVIRQKQINLNRRKLIQKTSEEFPEFMQSLEMDRKYKRKQLHLDFCAAYSFEEKQLNARTFNKWLADWATYEGLIMSVPERETNQGLGIFRDYFISFSRAFKTDN